MEHENKEMLFPGSVDEWRSKIQGWGRPGSQAKHYLPLS